jgi:hypothetical protein
LELERFLNAYGPRVYFSPLIISKSETMASKTPTPLQPSTGPDLPWLNTI